MTDRPFTTPEYPSTSADEGLREPHVDSHTTSTFAEAQVDASPTDSGYPRSDSSMADYPTTGSSTSSSNSSSTSAGETVRDTAATAKDEAKSVAADAKAGSMHVADTAKAEARDVAAEAQQQARALYRQLRTEVTDQAAGQSQRAASGLRTLSDELREMAAGGQHHGVASDLAGQASDRARGFAEWLDQREPGDILDEARDFARRRPGTFLAAAAALGFLGGRMTRGLADDDGSPNGSVGRPADADPVSSFSASTPTYGGEPYAAESAERDASTSPPAADTDRVGAGIDPAAYSHPDPEHRPADAGNGFRGDGHDRELR